MDRSELSSAKAFAMQFDSNSLLLRTILPGQVVAVNLERNTVDVQPCLRGKRANQEDSYLLPIINDVPIQYYGAGNFWVTFEPKEGDYCVLSVSDRSIEAWKKAGGIIDPKLNRHHDMTDAFAYFGMNPFPGAIHNIETDTMHVRTKDGSTGVRVKADEILYDVNNTNVAQMTSSLVDFKVPIKAPEATIAGVTQSTHSHPQGNDSAGNGQQDVGAPKNP